MPLSQAQFSAAQDKIDAMLRGSKRGTPERKAADAVSNDWEAVVGLPTDTAAQRAVRLDAIEAAAVRLGLIGGAK